MKLKQYYTQVYSSIRYKAKRRGDKLPNFTKTELIEWLNNNGIQKMWVEYLENGRDKNLKPSIDRINDYGNYEFSNMQLITWKENNVKGVNGEKHHKACLNTQNMKKVYIVKDDKKIDFNSLIDCSKWLGVHKTSVSRALCGKRKTIKGYKVFEKPDQ